MAMKIKTEHYEYMKRAIEAATVDKPLFELEGRYRTQGLTPKRFRWDCSYAAKLSTWVCDNLYSYLDDTHIDTALRSIMRDMKCDWAAQA